MFELQGEGRFRPDCSSWQTLSAELVRHNIRMGMNIAKYWRSVGEINVTTFLTLASGTDAPLNRRRKFTVIRGGK